MRIIIFATFLALLTAACNDTGRPVTANPVSPQPEASGNQPTPPQQGNAFSISTETHYQASLHSNSSSGQTVKLRLTPKGNAEMISDYLDKSPAIIDTGNWTTTNNGNLLLNLRRVGQKDSITLEFETDGAKLVYTGSEYGAAGLTLWATSAPESK